MPYLHLIDVSFDHDALLSPPPPPPPLSPSDSAETLPSFLPIYSMPKKLDYHQSKSD
jgi:hypothetical protein